MSLMDDDDDAFADLLAEAEAGGEEQGVTDADWDDIMRAAEEAAPDEYEEDIAPTRVQPQWAGSLSQTQTQVLPSQPQQRAPAPRTFADCFATQTSFNLHSSQASASSVISGSVNSSAHIPTRLTASANSTPAASSAPRSVSRATSSRGVAFGAAAPVAVETPTATFVQEAGAELRDPISGFKISNRLIASATLKTKLEGSKVVSLAEVLRRKSANPRAAAPAASANGGAPSAPAGGAFGILGNWVVFGVLTHKSLPKATSTGKGKFVVWTLSDLEGHHCTVLLFGKAFEAYWKIPDGAVLALANAEDSSGFGSRSSSFGANKPASGVDVCVSLKFAGQVLEVGIASDFSFCKAYKNEQTAHGPVKGMVRCKNVVNLSKGEFCEYHVKAEYKKVMNARPDLNQSRDARQAVVFAAPAVPPAKSTQANGTRIAAHMERTKIMARRDGPQQPPAEKKSLSALLLQAQSTRNARTSGADGKSLLYSREVKLTEEKKTEQAAKWTSLSDNSTVNSRFLQRVVASQMGQTSSVITTRETGLMAAVDKIKQEKVTAIAQLNGGPAAAPSANPTPRPSTAPAPRTRPVSAAQAAVNLARKDPAAAMAQFSYVAKNPLPQPAAPAPVMHGPPVAEAGGDRRRGGAIAASPASSAALKKPALTPPTATPFTTIAPRLSFTSSLAAAFGMSPTATRTPTTTTPAAATPQSARPSIPAASSTPSPRPASAATAAPAATPQPSSSSFLQSFGGSTLDGSAGLVPMLGRGWSHATPTQTQRPVVLNAGERRKEAQQAALVAQIAQLRAAGLLNKPDPNSTATPRAPAARPDPSALKRKSMDPPAATPQTTYSMRADGSVALSLPKPSSDQAPIGASPEECRAVAKRSKLADAFGQKHDSAAVDRILAQTSVHADLVQESASSVAAQEALFDLMERKEGMAVQLNAITQQTVKGFRCSRPGCSAPVSEYPLTSCKAKGHKFERVELQKRFFTCQQCKFHLSTLQAKLPTHACHKCGCTIWLKASMIPMKIDSSDRNLLQIKSEETFLRGAF